MAIRYVSFTVSEDTTVTPTTPQYGGVQGEHNATELAFIIATTGSLANDNYRYYIECVDAAGGVDRTGRLYRHGSEISTPVPLAWTQYGGISTVRLVAEEDGVVIYSVEGRLQFEDRGSAIEQVDGLLRTDISACMEVSRAAADTAQAAAEAAQAATDDCTDALDDARALADELRAAIDALPPIDTAIAEDVLWSSQHTVETLCPPIDMSGQRVVCYPIENHPLQVTVSRPNHLPFTYAPPIGEQTENGITFTRREDDTILVNGTATADATYCILSGYGEEKNPLTEAGITAPATLRLSGCPAGGGSDTYCLHYDTGRSNTYNNYGGNTTVSVTAEDVAVTGGWECYIRIKQGTTCDNLVFTPRLEPIGTVRLTRTHGEYEMISELKSLGEMSIMPTNRRMMFSVTPNATLRVRGYGSIPAALAELDGKIDAVEELDSKIDAVEEAVVAVEEAVAAAADASKTANALKGRVQGNAVAMSDISPIAHELDVTVDIPNLLQYPYTDTTKTENGITFTDNGDGSITVNGTATGEAYFELMGGGTLEELFGITDGEYTLSGCPSGGSVNGGYSLILSGDYHSFYDEGDGVSVNLADNSVIGECNFTIMIKPDVVCDNLVFRPQFKRSSATVKQYGKNLFDFKQQPKVITFTSNGGTERKYIGYEIHLPAGTYTLHAEAVDEVKHEFIYGAICDGQNKFVSSVNLLLGDTFQTVTITPEEGQVLYIYNGVSSLANDMANVFLVYYNVQIEVGETATPYEPYRGLLATATVEADGTVNGLMSHYPSTTLLTDAEGATIECEYNKDLNKAYDALVQAIISLGGNV